MKVICPKCKAKLVLPDEKLRPGGTKFKCSVCKATLAYKGKVQNPSANGAADSAPFSATPSAAEPEIQTSQFLPESGEQPIQESGIPDHKPDPAVVAPVAESVSPEIHKEAGKPRKMETADEIFTRSKRQIPISGKTVLIASGTVMSVIVVLLLLFSSRNSETRKQTPLTSLLTQTGTQPSALDSSAKSGPSVTPDSELPRTEATSSPALPSEMTDEQAIEIVKKSVGTMVNKWAEENSGRYSIIGWEAKKADEQRYLVSYLARDGERTTGFHFALDVQTGAIQDIANNRELQAKYNIQYGKARQAKTSP